MWTDADQITTGLQQASEALERLARCSPKRRRRARRPRKPDQADRRTGPRISARHFDPGRVAWTGSPRSSCDSRSSGPWAPFIFIALYVAAAVTLAPAFLLTVAAGALFGVWRGTLFVFIGAVLGASAAYAVSVRLTRLPFLSWLDRDPRVLVVRQAVAGEGAWVQFLLRLSPLVPFNLLNYALGLSHVRYRDFLRRVGRHAARRS